MRAAVYHGQRDVRIEDVPEPQPGPGQIKLRVGYNGICGTDVHEFFTGPHLIPHGSPHPRTGAIMPIVLGHEFAGEVVDVADDVQGFDIGDRIAAEPIYHCGECRFCRRGAYNLCTGIAFQGCDAADGGMAEFAVLDAAKAHRLPADLGLDVGALVEPLSVSHHAVHRADPDTGSVVVVYGGGPIGVGAFLALRTRGVERIVMVEPSADRAAVLTELGADAVIDPRQGGVGGRLAELTEGYGPDISIDCAGVQASFESAVNTTAKQGRIVLVATFPDSVTFQPNSLVLAERDIVSSCAYRGEDFEVVIRSIAEGHYPTEPWVQRIPIDRLVQDGFEALHEQRAMKVLVDVTAGAGS
jgi:(R,R)-butanediol dehydrogenase/meso-butanediol dehydrogenase/diacetyl reductase